MPEASISIPILQKRKWEMWLMLRKVTTLTINGAETLTQSGTKVRPKVLRNYNKRGNQDVSNLKVCHESNPKIRSASFCHCVSLNLSIPRGPLKWKIKNYSIMVIILALTFNKFIPALTSDV